MTASGEKSGEGLKVKPSRRLVIIAGLAWHLSHSRCSLLISTSLIFNLEEPPAKVVRTCSWFVESDSPRANHSSAQDIHLDGLHSHYRPGRFGSR